MSNVWRDLYLETIGMGQEELETFGTNFAEWQRGCRWWLGDVARAARRVLGDDNYSQVFPEWVSPDLIARCEAVAKAYPSERERNPLASWTTHMREANKPDRIQRVAAHVEAGRTSDEAAVASRAPSFDPTRWMLAIDVNYYLHRFWHSGAGVEAAKSVADWIQRTANRLREKGLTDVACCFDSPRNNRKELTTSWEDRYKDRPPKDPELIHQLVIVRDLLEGVGLACVSVEGMEGDDCLASYAVQFPGRVTILSQDKDCRQCLSEKCNILLDVEWSIDDLTGSNVPDYKWVSAATHTEETGIRPDQWCDFQCLMGDTVDGIKGCHGIGKKGAADLIHQFGTPEGAIAAAKAGDESIPESKRLSLIEFEGKLEVTRQLVTLRTDLELATNTRLT